MPSGALATVAVMPISTTREQSLRVVGLFAGIGGIELGLHQAGHTTVLLCEIDEGACNVLRDHFARVTLTHDVRELDRLPDAELLAAGFPCQDLSQAGRTAGIAGRNSGLVGEVFRLIAAESSAVRWLLLENVPFMLQLGRGRAMRLITDSLAAMGFTWAYRVVDTRAFGLPQRRQRVVLLASRTEDPRPVLFNEDAGDFPGRSAGDDIACGFYWTEGIRGLGWAVDAIPTLKGGSTVGIPSPPAIWIPQLDQVVLPDVRDAERLQGFAPDWTEAAGSARGTRARHGHRWKLVGNAVSVPLARWIGNRLRSDGDYDAVNDQPLDVTGSWPKAAWGCSGKAYRVAVSAWPLHTPTRHLLDFLEYPTKPLSARATEGFLRRTQVSRLRFPPGFLPSVRRHLEQMEAPALFALSR